MSIAKILVADDEMRIRVLLNDFLIREGYSVTEAENGKQALDLAINDRFDLIILDVMMPVMDGFEACKKIRQICDTPIMMLTARSEDIDELSGFDMGADDYVTKPFNPLILMARINARMKRKTDSNTSKFGAIEIYKDSHEVKINGKQVDFLPKEFTLLCYLIDNHDVVLSREQILDAVWGREYPGGDRTVDSHMNRLRSKLGVHRNMLQTIRGSGYKLTYKEIL
jgi:DNA-binding response OmpR family regulator